MKLERSKVDNPLWRKKVDSSLLNYNGTTIPGWACDMWGIQKQFKGINSKKDEKSQVKYQFGNNEYFGWVTEANKGRKTPAYRLWFSDDLVHELKQVFLMSYMRDIENKLRDEESDIEDEIPFWEFLDIEYDNKKRIFRFTAYYTQKPSFPELFRRLIGSPALKSIDAELSGKDKDRIFKQDWKPKSELKTEILAKNVIYMLMDSKNKELYVGEAGDLISRLSGTRPEIKNWNYYRYDKLPKSLEKHRIDVERMIIRDIASLLPSDQDIDSKEISRYKLVNKKIDKG